MLSLWMINIPVAAVITMVTTTILMENEPELKRSQSLLLSAATGIITIYGLSPFCKALWLYLDHVFHPLEERNE